MLVETEGTIRESPLPDSKGKDDSLHFARVQTWNSAGTPKASEKPGGDLKPANLKTATMDA